MYLVFELNQGHQILSPTINNEVWPHCGVTTNLPMGETNYSELEWEGGHKTQLRAKLLQTLSDLGVLPEAGPRMRC